MLAAKGLRRPSAPGVATGAGIPAVGGLPRPSAPIMPGVGYAQAYGYGRQGLVDPRLARQGLYAQAAAAVPGAYARSGSYDRAGGYRKGAVPGYGYGALGKGVPAVGAAAVPTPGVPTAAVATPGVTPGVADAKVVPK